MTKILQNETVFLFFLLFFNSLVSSAISATVVAHNRIGSATESDKSSLQPGGCRDTIMMIPPADYQFASYECNYQDQTLEPVAMPENNEVLVYICKCQNFVQNEVEGEQP